MGIHIQSRDSQRVLAGRQGLRLLAGKDYTPERMNSLVRNWVMDSSLHGPSVHKYGHAAAVGLGRSPPSPRWGPHFREKGVEVAYALEGEGGELRDRVWPDDEKIGGALVPDVVLQQEVDAG